VHILVPCHGNGSPLKKNSLSKCVCVFRSKWLDCSTSKELLWLLSLVSPIEMISTVLDYVCSWYGWSPKKILSHVITLKAWRLKKTYIIYLQYRVSIESFADCKHLLQENYVEYKHIFLPLLKLVSKILCHVFIVNICNIWFLDATFSNRWIERDGLTPWPPRSPDITPLDFFLWGCVKDKVFLTPVLDIINLRARITDVFATVTENMLEDMWRESDFRLDILRATKGAHVEVY